ncbi:VanZ family protein [Paenibacillus sp. PCH8]|uniref:VanZ family protein n=1 Tax=Paenibacillus sp. PCH8 TaxID=2066524 RepID=UPI000CFA2713|nr:VanZ family protein [Paenibacillus sp. PCH8]PQP82910.1 VanZ family protein [Paenibacillus sp. PCH8]
MKVVMINMMEEGSARTRQKYVRRTYGLLMVLLLMVVIWVLVIWSMSTQSYQQQNIQPWLHKWSQKMQLGFTLPDVQFTYGEYDYSLKQRPYDFAEFIFRKSAHLFVYAVLAVLVYGGLKYRRIRSMTCIVAALALVLIIASIDEYIQQFSPNRTSSIRDVGVDVLGGCCGIAIYAGLRFLSRKISKRGHSSIHNK